MKKYFLYELRKNAFLIGCLTLFASLVYCAAVLTSGNLLRGASETYVWIISSIGGTFATIAPIWFFGYKMKRRSVDLYFSLPISRLKILSVKFLIGLIVVFVPYSAAYWLGAFSAMARAFDEMNAVYYIPQYFASLLPIYFIYAISSFVFTRANTVADGVVFIFFWAFAAGLAANVLAQLTAVTEITGYDIYYGTPLHRTTYYIEASHYFPFAPLDYATGHFEQHIANYLNIHATRIEATELANVIAGFSVTSLSATGATAGLFLNEKRAKAENAGQISESYFGYRTMIPLYTVCLSAVCFSPVLLALIIACAFFLTVAYKRTFRIGIKQTVVFSVSAAAGIILYLIIVYV